MNELQNDLVKIAIAHQSKNAAAFDSQVIDLSNLREGEFEVKVGALGAALTVFRIMESDIKTNATTLGGSPNQVVDLAKLDSNQDGTITVINLRKYLNGPHKKYGQLQATAGAAVSTLDANFRGEPLGANGFTAADRGVDSVVHVESL